MRTSLLLPLLLIGGGALFFATKEAKADEKKTTKGGKKAPPGVDLSVTDMPFTIRSGDAGPFQLAQYYLGKDKGARFKELRDLNPQLGSMKTIGFQKVWDGTVWKDDPSKPIKNYEGWIPGADILIPADWNPWDKAIPNVGFGSPSNKFPDPKELL